jgi:uncharacterized protein (TIGR03083 family)
MADARRLAAAERAEFADLLADLDERQWSAASLCDGWTVRDVVVHTVAYLGQSRVRLTGNMIRCRGNVDKINADGLREHAATMTGELTAMMRRGVEPSGAGALYGGRVALIECLIHQQDVRRPLGLERTIGEEPLRAAMDYARVSPVIGGRRRTRGVRMVATDMDWSAGDGPDVHGSGEALLLAMTGRAAKIAGELGGDGVALLR